MDILEDTYELAGVVARCCLQMPAKILDDNPIEERKERVKKELLNYINTALNKIDKVLDNQDFNTSGRLLHMVPANGSYDTGDARQSWASVYIANRFQALVTDTTAQKLKYKLSQSLGAGQGDAAAGVLFEVFAKHIFRTGGCTLRARRLDNTTKKDIQQYSIPSGLKIIEFKGMSSLPLLDRKTPVLYFPGQNFPCVDLIDSNYNIPQSRHQI